MSSIKNHFVSRYTKGKILEFDYRQLEIRVLALATMCQQLIDDINDDIDLHTHFASQIYNKAENFVTPEERKLAKGFSFQLQYGAGAYSISKFWKVDKKLVESFIDSYYTRYPEVKEWQDKNIEWCKNHNVNLGHRKTLSHGEEPVHTTYVPNIWGFNGPVGSFMLDGTPRRNYRGEIVEKFSPTQIKNYPIQGGAADIVLLMLTQLHLNDMVCPSDDLYCFINTVHDSFIYDLNWFNYRQGTINNIMDVLESVPDVLKDMFGIESPVPFPVDVSIGSSWGQTTEIMVD